MAMEQRRSAIYPCRGKVSLGVFNPKSLCKSELLVLRVCFGRVLVECTRATAVACFLRGLASGVHARQRGVSAVRLTIARLTLGWAIGRHFTSVAK